MSLARTLGPALLLHGLLGGWADAAEDCGNARDDDGDGEVDCRDTDCCAGANCAPLPCQRFRRGDVDADGAWTILDGIRILLALTEPMPLACEDSADFDDSGSVDITDAVLLLRFLFGAGAAPPVPFPSCGFDPTPEQPLQLGCGFEHLCT